MPNQSDRPTHDQRTGRFRFTIIGSLLSNPPARGELQGRLQQLSQKTWTDPQGGQPTRYGVSTLERWYYRALHAPGDPVRALSSVVRSDYSTHPSMKAGLSQLLLDQYRSHPSWSYQLHRDNLVALAQEQPQLAPVPSYSVVRRFMKAHGLVKRPRRGRGDTAGSRAAEQRFECFEVRSYEVPCAHQLWHLDFHSGSLKVLLPDGQWVHPKILGILDDHTRLCVHAQWYLAETAENLVHGLSQALQKHHLPRAILSDNGSAMIAAEIVQGLERLGIVHNTTLPHSPYQNGKQEVLWGQIEGRLLAMLEGCANLTLEQLNQTTQVWINSEYHNKVHRETRQSPKSRFLAATDLSRPCPSSEALREAFTAQIKRIQRRSDGTVSLQRVRFEIPSRYRHLTQLCLRYASWDLSHVYLCDERSGQLQARLYPQDKHRNADGKRKRQSPLLDHAPTPSAYGHDGTMAPLMQQLMERHEASGRPAAYLPKDERPVQGGDRHE